MIDEEIRMVALFLVMITGIALISQSPLIVSTFEPFSAIGVLGPNMVVGDYPKIMVVNTSYRLYLYLENNEGHVIYYQINVKLGDNSTFINETVPSDAAVIATYEVILPSGENAVLPVDLIMETPITNAKILFEMWAVDSDGTHYKGKWNQLWVNATIL